MQAQETALIKNLTPTQQKAAEAYASRAKRATLAAIKERMPHLADNSINAAEHIGGGLVGWGAELGTRAIIDKLAQPNEKGEVGTVGKYKDYVKGGVSLVLEGVGVLVNAGLSGSTEGSMPRRVAMQASATQLLFGADRLLTKALGLPQ